MSSPHLPSAVSAERSHLQIPSQPDWIAPTVEYLKQKAVLCGACQESRAGKVLLALHEALTNAIVHGNLELSSDLKERGDNVFVEALAERTADPRYNQRVVDVEMDYDGARCRWTLTDEGQGFDVERVVGTAEPEPEDLLRPSGRGILLMKAFLDEVHFEAGGRRVVLTLLRSSGAEKRRQERRPVHQPVRVAPIRADGSVDWTAAYEAVSHNLSADGIAILQSRLAATPRILLGLDWEGQVLYVPAEVRHCRSMAEDAVEIGCRFQPPVDVAVPSQPVEDVQRAITGLLERLQAEEGTGDERRIHPRAVYTGRIGIAGGPATEPTFGFARDLSRGGIAFLTTGPLELAERVLSLPQADAHPLGVVVQVLRCVPIMEGIFDVGARFVDLHPRPSPPAG
jgi:anti-sigma regulatory factor (Ser/Thr protein kinase)